MLHVVFIPAGEISASQWTRIDELDELRQPIHARRAYNVLDLAGILLGGFLINAQRLSKEAGQRAVAPNYFTGNLMTCGSQLYVPVSFVLHEFLLGESFQSRTDAGHLDSQHFADLLHSYRLLSCTEVGYCLKIVFHAGGSLSLCFLFFHL